METSIQAMKCVVTFATLVLSLTARAEGTKNFWGGVGKRAAAVEDTTPTQDPRVLSTRQWYKEVNRNLPRYRKVVKDLQVSTEGGLLTAWFDGASLVKIATGIYGETGRAFEEYYFQGDKLIFAFVQIQRYAGIFGKIVSNEKERFYFEGGRLYRWVKADGRIVSSADLVNPQDLDPKVIGEFEENARWLPKASKLFFDGARSRDATISAPPDFAK